MFQCSTICINNDWCVSFHMNGEGACVFGVEQGEMQLQDAQAETVNDGQVIRIKGG